MRYPLTKLGFATVALALGFSGQAAAASIAPAPIDFGDVALNTKVTMSMTITVDSGYEVEIATGAGINAPFEFSFGTCSGSTCSDTESFTPTSIGPVGGTLDVDECPTAGGSCIPIPVFVEGVGAYPSLDSPPTLDFGAQTTGSPSAVSWLTHPKRAWSLSVVTMNHDRTSRSGEVVDRVGAAARMVASIRGQGRPGGNPTMVRSTVASHRSSVSRTVCAVP